jgi:hypothetical protein
MAVIFCGTFCWRLGATRLLTGALLYAVRTFLGAVGTTIVWLVAKNFKEFNPDHSGIEQQI